MHTHWNWHWPTSSPLYKGIFDWSFYSFSLFFLPGSIGYLIQPFGSLLSAMLAGNWPIDVKLECSFDFDIHLHAFFRPYFQIRWAVDCRWFLWIFRIWLAGWHCIKRPVWQRFLSALWCLDWLLVWWRRLSWHISGRFGKHERISILTSPMMDFVLISSFHSFIQQWTDDSRCLDWLHIHLCFNRNAHHFRA